MKKIGLRKGVAAVAVLLLALILWAGFTPPVSVSAETANLSARNGDYTIEEYDVKMTVQSNRTILVTERITAYLYYRQGIIRDLPIGSGVRYRNLVASCEEISGFSSYYKPDSFSYLSWYLDTGATATRQVTFTLSYEMIVPARASNFLSLNVIGYGWDTALNNVTVVVDLPAGPEKYTVYSGSVDTTENGYAEYAFAENTLTITSERLPLLGYSTAAGITVDFTFGKGVLSTTFDMSILWAVLLGLGLLAIAVLVKLFLCRSPQIVKTVNLEAPNNMDPLRMGKLFDNKVDGEDLGALVFYLASKDYLSIDFTKNESDPTLIRTQKKYAEDLPEHCKIFCDGLFENSRKSRNEKSVCVSALSNSFYRTADAVKKVVCDDYALYQKRSIVLMVLFGILSILLFGGFPLVYGMAVIGSGYRFLATLVFSVPAFLVALICSVKVSQHRFKWKTPKKIALTALGVICGVAFALTGLLFQSAASVVWTSFILIIFAAVLGITAGAFLCRTKEYTKDLGQILGFKQFIEVTERDKIEFMLKEDHELYYNVLPYAQVLGITKSWTDKFKDLNLSPPKYAYCRTRGDVFNCLLWSTMFLSMNKSFASNMLSRPRSGPSSAGGGGGGFRGGGFGGRGGGGFGGGGGRSF